MWWAALRPRRAAWDDESVERDDDDADTVEKAEAHGGEIDEMPISSLDDGESGSRLPRRRPRWLWWCPPCARGDDDDDDDDDEESLPDVRALDGAVDPNEVLEKNDDDDDDEEDDDEEDEDGAVLESFVLPRADGAQDAVVFDDAGAPSEDGGSVT